MKEFLVCYLDGRGQLTKARRLTDEEKKQYVKVQFRRISVRRCNAEVQYDNKTRKED